MSELQEGIDTSIIACEELGMKISVSKVKVLHMGKTKEASEFK